MNEFAGHAEKRWNELLEGAVQTVPSADFMRVFIAGQYARAVMVEALAGVPETEVIQFAEASFARWMETVRAALVGGTAIPTSGAWVVALGVEEPSVAAIEPEAAPVLSEPVVAPMTPVVAPKASVAPPVTVGDVLADYEARVGEVVDVDWLAGKPWMQRMYVDLGRVMLQQYGDVTETLNWLANHLKVMERAGRLHGDIGG